MCRACLRGCGLHERRRHRSRISRPDRRLRPAPADRGAGLAARLPSGGLDAAAGAVSANLQLDLVEDLALGKEWQLGYWKHPPLPWWVADLAYRLTGQIDAVYMLGPLAAVICFYAVWLLAREVAGEFKALIAVVALEAIHFYNFSVVKFAHDQMQLPFWALTGLFFWRAIVRGRTLDWMLAGVFLAGAFWSKYAAFALAATLGLILLFDPFARRAWRTPGPYVMAAVFAIVIAPNVWWLVNNDFLPFHYVDGARRGGGALVSISPVPAADGPAASSLYLAPTLALLALLYLPRSADQALSRQTTTPPSTGAMSRRSRSARSRSRPLSRPLLGRQPIAMWGYPLWTFAPLAVLMFGRRRSSRRSCAGSPAPRWRC